MRAVMGLALCGALAAGTAQAAECRLQQYDSIPMTITENALQIPVTLGDVEKRFTIDLGASSNHISESLAKKLATRFRPVNRAITIRVDGEKVTEIAVIPKFQIGKVALDNVEFLSVPGMADGETSGEIGTFFLGSFDFEFDMAASKLNLFSPDHCPERVVYWTKSGYAQLPYIQGEDAYLRVPMELDGKTVQVGFRARGRSMIGMNSMRRLFGVDENSPGMTKVETLTDGTILYRYSFTTLVADGLTLKNPVLFVMGEKREPACDGTIKLTYPNGQPKLYKCFGGADVWLGLSVYSRLHLYFSSKEKLLYLTDAKAR